MDKDQRQGGKRDWSWLPAFMPGVANQIKQARAKWGDEHVNECWTRGVIKREPGWFFAREGALAIGTPWDDPVMANFAAAQVTSTQSLVCMATPAGEA